MALYLCIHSIVQRQSTGWHCICASIFLKHFNDGRQDSTVSVHPFNSSTTVDRMALYLCIHFLKHFNDGRQDGTVSVHPFLKQFNDGRQDGIASMHPFLKQFNYKQRVGLAEIPFSSIYSFIHCLGTVTLPHGATPAHNGDLAEVDPF